MIEYIFSDKTGTLTKNELVFRSIAIANGVGSTVAQGTSVAEVKA